MVDDDKFLLEMYSIKLTKAGFEVLTLENFKDNFIEKVVAFQPDLVSLDIIVPEVDGFRAAEMLRNDPRTRDTPFIFLSNLGGEENVEKAQSLGAVGYLICAKTNPDQLAKIFSKLIKLAKNKKAKQMYIKLDSGLNLYSKITFSELFSRRNLLIFAVASVLFILFTAYATDLSNEVILLVNLVLLFLLPFIVIYLVYRPVFYFVMKLKNMWPKIRTKFQSPLLILILVVAVLFYWYEWRPAQIRENCAEEYGGRIKSQYDHCLKLHGLNYYTISEF